MCVFKILQSLKKSYTGGCLVSRVVLIQKSQSSYRVLFINEYGAKVGGENADEALI